ncbi:type II toxin-antitoxin system HipA family toxin [Phragmitibacter flavus]|uniref:Type II toxin-antitoxin system HipA family toxin n=1 Tax=Phragmitibacter flavus TaxID=2576071 RepID=A0A5R8KH81_9BACT|nr:type II toxin-antitoxin system HipA family toxin [Phragmitibacter flavus]TLD71674.1 type II toxin-antitoxin system HipA family toxin [Phragmitibacter flavus]
MKLGVFVLGTQVATLESVGDFKSVLTYEAGAHPDHLVSLTMPVRTESWVWDDPLHPIFRMNLPEGYLLHVLEEKFGPHIGASPSTLLSIVGRNMIGRVQVAAPGANLNESVTPLDVAVLLKGDNSERAFSALVRKYAASGVSGVVPKFLDAQQEPRFSQYNKATLLTRKHIVKGSSQHLPYIALNEHLCMQVAAKVVPSAPTEVSQDGQALVVHRFDVDEEGLPKYALEDFCALLGMRPSAKYETTWERIGKAVRDHVPGPRQHETFRHLAATILLTYALRNADCHSKNIALLYTSREDVRIAPVYDMLTTSIYAEHKNSPPGISFMGKKTWQPGKNLSKFLTGTFGISAKEQATLVEKISDAISDTAPLVRQAMDEHPGFRELGKHLLNAWSEGIGGLRDKRTYAMSEWKPGEAFLGFSDPPKLRASRKVTEDY